MCLGADRTQAGSFSQRSRSQEGTLSRMAPQVLCTCWVLRAQSLLLAPHQPVGLVPVGPALTHPHTCPGTQPRSSNPQARLPQVAWEVQKPFLGLRTPGSERRSCPPASSPHLCPSAKTGTGRWPGGITAPPSRPHCPVAQCPAAPTSDTDVCVHSRAPGPEIHPCRALGINPGQELVFPIPRSSQPVLTLPVSCPLGI